MECSCKPRASSNGFDVPDCAVRRLPPPTDFVPRSLQDGECDRMTFAGQRPNPSCGASWSGSFDFPPAIVPGAYVRVPAALFSSGEPILVASMFNPPVPYLRTLAATVPSKGLRARTMDS